MHNYFRSLSIVSKFMTSINFACIFFRCACSVQPTKRFIDTPMRTHATSYNNNFVVVVLLIRDKVLLVRSQLKYVYHHTIT